VVLLDERGDEERNVVGAVSGEEMAIYRPTRGLNGGKTWRERMGARRLAGNHGGREGAGKKGWECLEGKNCRAAVPTACRRRT
jgi:hypothetical protein